MLEMTARNTSRQKTTMHIRGKWTVTTSSDHKEVKFECI